MTTTPSVYLLDVEGTIAPISLVSEQLFPFARAHFQAFLQQHQSDPDVQADLALLAEENRVETDPGVPRMTSAPGLDSETWESKNPNGARDTVLAYLLWLMDRDRKSTALKALQGRIWKVGFESGELKGTLFSDVPPLLHRWAAKGRVAIYSSGSTTAQQLLFRYSNVGDLTSLIAAYFDTRTGAKSAPASYTAIAAAMQVDPPQVRFFSDVVRELNAAREAGMQTQLVVREGNAAVEDPQGHIVINAFDASLST